ncbi:MAG: hypothetical protein LBR00_05535 [Clostridiales Family XIII bacterium]|jgi:YbbR domain-containing protein|nr:hypothetical protein [Clostridiales Family XIII bacterium]
MLQNNKLNLLISIVAAIVLWAWVTMAINPPVEQTIRNVPVDLINMESLYDRGLTVSGTQTYLVDVVISGAQSDVNELTASDLRATADMTGFPKGAVDVKVNVVVPSSTEMVQVRPETIRAQIVDRITVTKPVRLTYAETFPQDVEPGFVTVVPDELEVAGAAEEVDNIEYIRAEIPEGVLSDESRTFTLEPVPIGKDGAPSYDVSLSQDSISATATLCAVKKVPLEINQVGQPPETVGITDIAIPKTITIRGPKAILDGVKTVRAQDVNLATLRETVELPVEPILPDGVEVADQSKELAVIIEVEGISKKEFSYTADEIEVANLADGLFGHVNTGSVKVTLLAPESEIGDFTKDDIRVFVDAADVAAPGDAIEMAVKMECEKEYKSIRVSPENVRVTINDDGGAETGTGTGTGTLKTAGGTNSNG